MLIPYEEIRNTVKDGDLILWRPTNLLGCLICIGESLYHRRIAWYSHAAMAAWGRNGRLYQLEMIGWYGGRHVPLSKVVAKHPRRCEIWHPVDPLFNAHGAVEQMLWVMGQRYSYTSLFRVAVRQFIPQFLLPRIHNSDDPDQPLICSAAYSWAARTGGGVSPCPEKFDREVTPADLALSKFAKHVATPF